MTPRIYNLFPKLVGSMAGWITHLDRIVALGCDWVYVNPWHYAGYSGSLYAVADHYRYADLFLEGPEPGDVQLRRFLDAAHARGLKVMMDWVVNHTAFDATLVAQHPEWYEHELDGSIKHPGCVDHGKWVAWGDLAQLDHLGPHHLELWAYWHEVAAHYLDLGVDGFRCDAAYHVPLEVWEWLLPAIRADHPAVTFFAETLGCRAREVLALAQVGFDCVFNSSKWWDLQADWFLTDYRRWSGCAPSIAFPESHDTPRLAEEFGGDMDRVRQRYVFAALMSAGVMLPMGFEWGFRTKLDVVHTRPEDQEPVRADLVDFIRQVHEVKLAHPIWGMDGDLYLLPAGDPMVTALVKQSPDKQHKGLLVFNRDPHQARRLFIPEVADALGVGTLREIAPGMPAVPLHLEAMVDPSGFKIFVGEPTVAEVVHA